MMNAVRRLLLCIPLLAPTLLCAQGTAFTYQGRLNDGANLANGVYDLRFSTYGTNTTGSPTSFLITNLGVQLVSGLFTVTLDFSNGPFTGSAQWLQMDVRTNGASSFTALAPRQQVTATPYAIMAGSASNMVGVLPGSQLVTNFSAGLNLNGSFGGVFYGTLNNFNSYLPTTLSNVAVQVATPLNLGGGTNLSAWQVNYGYKTISGNYNITTNDVVLDCTGVNQLITLLPAANFPPATTLTIWSDNASGAVVITNSTGSEAITVPGQGQALSVVLGPANSPSNSITLMVHGGHW
jgi:hypothetical protein